MNEIEKYEFDRVGYLTVPGLLTDKQVKSLRETIDALEEEAAARVAQSPRWPSPIGRVEYHHNVGGGYYQGNRI